MCGWLLSDTGVNIPRSSVSQSPLRCVFSGQPQCLCQDSDTHMHTHTAAIVKQQDECRHDFNDLKKRKKAIKKKRKTTFYASDCCVAILSIMLWSKSFGNDALTRLDSCADISSLPLGISSAKSIIKLSAVTSVN